MTKNKWVILAFLCVGIAAAVQWVLLESVSKNELKVYALTKDVEAGHVLNASDCQVVKLKAVDFTSTVESQNYVTQLETVSGQVVKTPLKRGMLLMPSQFKKESAANKQLSMVLSLDVQGAHLGQLAPKEQVALICSRQGQSKYYDQIRVSQIQVVSENSLPIYLVTLEGEANALTEAMLAQREGVIRIVKKIPE